MRGIEQRSNRCPFSRHRIEKGGTAYHAFVEPVARKIGHQIEQLLGLLLGEMVLLRALKKQRFLLVHVLRFLLPHRAPEQIGLPQRKPGEAIGEDRKSTRLNSSHSQISYAVFCLKKKYTQISLAR